MLTILLMDDSEEKINVLQNEINSLFPCGECTITVADSLVEGRRLMHDCQYDLLVLDMVLPERSGDDQIHSAGSDYLEELASNPNLIPPLQVIGLTEYEEEFNAKQQEFKDRLWYLLYYSQHNDDWKKGLKQKLLQLFQMKSGMLESLSNANKYDIGIICALGEEFTQMLKSFEPLQWDDVSVEGYNYSFKTTIVTTSRLHDLKIIAACADKPGMVASSVITTIMYSLFKVNSVFMTGITAGIGEDIKLKDIIIAESIHDYASGKVKQESDGEVKLLKEMNQIQAKKSIISKVNAFIREQRNLNKINNYLTSQKVLLKDEQLLFKVSKTVCGPFVMTAEDIIAKLVADERKLQALDMEGFGLYLTAHIFDREALWIKSISDFADTRKNDDCHSACSLASGRFLYEFLRESY